MKTLPANITLEKNKLETPSAFLILLEVTLPDATKFYLTNNNEQVTFNAQVYTPIPFQLDPIKEQLQGQLQVVNLRISNVTRLMQSYLEATNGGIGSVVTLTVVNSAYLAESYSELTMTFDVVSCSTDINWVNFGLGAPNPLRRRFPLHRYLPSNCRWVSNFKGAECAYAGIDSTCKGTYDDCLLKANQVRFGGFKGLEAGGLRVV